MAVSQGLIGLMLLAVLVITILIVAQCFTTVTTVNHDIVYGAH